MTRIHVACSARNAGRWIDAFVESLMAQTHTDWRLTIRDDGSTDDTRARLVLWQRRESRVLHVIFGDRSMGSAQGFADVFRQLPADAEYIATADADDVWLPNRLERTSLALSQASGPTLVHGDLRVVDESLRELAPSFWRSEGLDPRTTALASLAIQNVAVGPTLLFNHALLDELRDVPADAIHQDWWIALVAAATGRIVAIPEATVLYRQHGSNTAGARERAVYQRLRRTVTEYAKARTDLNRTAAQAAALLERYGSRITERDRQVLQGLSSIARLHGVARKIAIARWRWLPSHGVMRNIGILVRG